MRLSYGHRRIRFRVTSCSDYSDRSVPSIRKMEEIAWVLRTDGHRREIGFVKSKDLEEDERYALSDGEFD